MKMCEVLAYVQEEKLNVWFRPSSWVGSGRALSINKFNKIEVVPNPKADFWMVNNVNELLEDWVMVVPEAVLEEDRKPLYFAVAANLYSPS